MLEYGNLVGKTLWAVTEDSIGTLWVESDVVEYEDSFTITFKNYMTVFQGMRSHSKAWQKDKPYLFESELDARREEKRILESKAEFMREKILTVEKQIDTATQRIMELGGEIDG